MRRLAPLLLAAAALGWTAAAAGAQTPPVTARASFTPSVHLFADPVQASIDVAVDPERVDPQTVTVKPDFSPYSSVGHGVERTSGGPHLVLLRFAYELRCLTGACAPQAPQKSFTFRPALIRYRLLDHGRAATATETTRVPVPPLTVASRLTPQDRAQPVLRGAVAPPAPSARVAPGPLGIALIGAGGTLALAGAAGLAVLLRPRRRAVPTPPLRAALELVERCSAGEVGDRRRALYRLALALEQARLEPPAREARKLAWASRAPAPETMRDLAARVRDRVEDAA